LLHIGIMTIVRSRERPRFLGLISSALQTRAKAFIFLQDESLQFPAAHKARSNECQRERIKNCQLSRYAYRAEIRFFQFVCMRIRRERERERGEKVGWGKRPGMKHHVHGECASFTRWLSVVKWTISSHITTTLPLSNKTNDNTPTRAPGSTTRAHACPRDIAL